MTMNYWIFVMTGNNSDFLNRIKNNKWELYRKTSNRLKIQKGDKILFYLARFPRQKIVANAILKSNVTSVGDKFFVDLSELEIWKKQISIKPFIESLDFIKNKSKWGGYLQGGISKISENDYLLLSKNPQT